MKDLKDNYDFMRRDADVCGAIKHITALVDDDDLSSSSTLEALYYIEHHLKDMIRLTEREQDLHNMYD